MSYAIMLDFGSTYTKVAVVDRTKQEIILTDKFASTVHSDAMVNLQQCFDAAKTVLTEEEFDSALKLSSSSAAGGLRMAVVGLTKGISITAGRDAVFGAGAKVMGSFYGMLTEEQVKEIEELDLEIILLCGGYEHGNVSMVMHNANMLAKSRIVVPVVYSGNNDVATYVRHQMKSHRKECFVIDNIIPNVGVLNVEPSQEIIRHLFMQRITNMKGLSQVKESIGKISMPTPAAVLTAGELLSTGTSQQEGFGPLMIVDVGGATTDVYSYNVNKGYDGATLTGIPEPFGKRTVEGDMGMRESSICLYNEMEKSEIANDAEVSEAFLEQAINKRITSTSFLADSEEEYRVDQTIARNAVRISARRHVGKLEYTYSGQCEMVQRGKNLTEIKTVIGTGGVVVNSKDPKKILSQVEKKSSRMEELLLPSDTQSYIDKEYVFYAAGLLREYDEETALAIMKKSLTKVK